MVESAPWVVDALYLVSDELACEHALHETVVHVSGEDVCVTRSLIESDESHQIRRIQVSS